jgi:arsenate reductase
MDVTIFHNPACSTSRKVLERLRSFGVAPTVVDYVKTGWTRVQLQDLLREMGKTPRDILRTKGDLVAELGLTAPGRILTGTLSGRARPGWASVCWKAWC